MANHPDYLQVWEIEHSYSRREHYAIKSAGRRGRLYGAPGKITLKEWRQLKKECDYRCQLCGKKEPEIILSPDHIKPMSEGGSNFISNIQPLCGKCNNIKAKNEKPQEWKSKYIDKRRYCEQRESAGVP